MSTELEANIVFHEFLHDFGVGEAYEVDANGNITYSALGDVMGAGWQSITNTSMSQADIDDFVFKLLQLYETMKHYSTDYAGISGNNVIQNTQNKIDAQKELK